MKTIIKLLIVIIIVFAFIFSLYTTYPNYKNSDLYEVSGICTDVRKETGPRGKGSYLRIYIVMDNGEDYFISEKLWKYIGGDQNSMIGQYISFSASDKAVHWLFSHEFVTWNDNAESQKTTLKILNKEKSSSRIMGSIMTLLVGSVVMLPDAVKFLQKRYEIKLKQISEENRIIRRAKRQAKREYFNDPNNVPDMRNASKKKKRKR